MSKEDVIAIQGTVMDALSHALFRIKLETGHLVLAHLGGKMRLHHIKLAAGDQVMVEVSPYDLTHGRIASVLKRKAA